MMEVESKVNIDELWKMYSAKKDPDTKNLILIYYIDLVKKIVQRIMPKYREYNNSDDLISCGIIGLIDAIDKYDIRYEVKFETYASIRVRGEILDYMRKQDWAPSSLRKKINNINQVTEKLENTLGHYPTDKEIAEYLKIPITEVHKVLEKTHTFNLMYFEDMVTDAYYVDKVSDSEDNNPAEIMQNKETTRILAEIIDTLAEKEKLVISLYYYEEMTLKEIAGILNVSESRVSQIHSKAVAQLGYRMKRVVQI